MRRQHHRVHVVAPRWVFILAPLALVGSWAGAFALGRTLASGPRGASEPVKAPQLLGPSSAQETDSRGLEPAPLAPSEEAASGSVPPDAVELDAAPPGGTLGATPAHSVPGEEARPLASDAPADATPSPDDASTEGPGSAEEDPPLPSPPEVGWGVQVGAFASAAEARAWLDAHAPESPAFLSEVDLGERGTWYRLRLGRHPSQRAARAAARRWARRLDEAPLVVEYP